MTRCRRCASYPRRCSDSAPIVISTAGPQGRLLRADTGQRIIELPRGWRRTPAGIIGASVDLAQYVPELEGLRGGGAGVRVGCCGTADARYLQARVAREGPNGGGGILLFIDRLAGGLFFSTARVAGVLWISGGDPIAVTGPPLTLTPFATLNPGRIAPVDGDLVRITFDPTIGTLSCFVNGVLWGATSGLQPLGVRFAGIAGLDLDPPLLFDDIETGCLTVV